MSSHPSRAQSPRPSDLAPICASTPAIRSRLATLGAGGLGQGEDRAEADFSQHRLFHLPLVPCHGPRIVRKRRGGRGPERELHPDQGRSGGEAGRGPGLHVLYVQALTGQGGWPLSAWLTPDLKPFSAAPIFRPEDRHGRPGGFLNLLRALAYALGNEREKILGESERVMTAFARRPGGERPKAGRPERELAAAAEEASEKGPFAISSNPFDPSRGGFGGAPKVPPRGPISPFSSVSPPAAARQCCPPAARRVGHGGADSLRQMARGGIHDQVGGGFHPLFGGRGLVAVPHFEKMLYDQAQIASNAIGPGRRRATSALPGWCAIFSITSCGNLAHPEGGFYSAEDADSVAAGRLGELSPDLRAPGDAGRLTKASIALLRSTPTPMSKGRTTFGPKPKSDRSSARKTPPSSAVTSA